MLIDWFTVAAQLLNFLILVWLLKRFLYKPILQAIDAREKSVAAELADAAAKRTTADRERDEFRNKNQALDEAHATLLAKAQVEVKAERDRLLAQARTEADDLRTKQATALRNDRAQLGVEITRLAKREVFAVARKALADLAAVSLEQRMSEVFVQRVRELTDPAKQSLAAELKNAGAAVVRSTFEMPAADRLAIQKALADTFSADVPIRFESAPDAICGIELHIDGRKLAWTIADYLATLEQTIGSLIDAQAASSAHAAA
jgi:F-type H+-transporting ATPase subunit b